MGGVPRPRGLGILRDLRLEGGQAVKLLFLAQEMMEPDIGLSAINIPVKIKQMRFEDLVGAVHRRAYADIGDTWKGLAIDTR